MNEKITGIILAGGKSSRMGCDKGLMKIAGRSCTEHVYMAIKPVVSEVIIISNRSGYEHLEIPVFNDIIKECGPIAGIHSGLTHSKNKVNLVVACDMPFINSGLLAHILSNRGQSEIALAEHEGSVEPLCSFFSKECTSRVEELLLSGERKLINILKEFSVKKISVSSNNDFYSTDLFFNLNRQVDLDYVSNKLEQQ